MCVCVCVLCSLSVYSTHCSLDGTKATVYFSDVVCFTPVLQLNRVLADKHHYTHHDFRHYVLPAKKGARGHGTSKWNLMRNVCASLISKGIVLHCISSKYGFYLSFLPSVHIYTVW